MQKYHNNTLVIEEQPSEIITQQQEILDAAELYIAKGLALVPIPFGGKGPRVKGWNNRANTITSPDQIELLTGQNIGLAHAYSGTCAIDIDDYVRTDEILTEHGLNLTELLTADDAVQISSGVKNRAKLLYRIPGILPTFQFIEEGKTIFEFRCGIANGLTHQDVLPPSIHPNTGEPYIWIGDWHNLPMLPGELHKLWLQNKPTVQTFTAPKDKNPQRKDMFSMGVTTFPMGICSAYEDLCSERRFRKKIITSVTQDEINQLCQDHEVQQHLLAFLGFKDFDKLFTTGAVSVRSPFREDKHKSGGLVIGDYSGLPMFHDFGGAFGSHYLQLNSLYASLISGSLTILKPTLVDGRKIGLVASAVWFLRLLIDAGVIAPGKVNMPDCPVETNKTIQKVHAGIKRLFEVRWAFKGREDKPIMLGRKFLGNWCGVSEDQARESMKYLLKHCIHTAGKHGLANIYLPGYKPPEKPKGRTDK